MDPGSLGAGTGIDSDDGPIAVVAARSTLGEAVVGSGGGEDGGFCELRIAVVVSERMARYGKDDSPVVLCVSDWSSELPIGVSVCRLFISIGLAACAVFDGAVGISCAVVITSP